MKRTAIALAACLSASLSPWPALAQGRPLSLALTCGQAAGLVTSRGAVVMSTGRSTYSRYVSDRGFCTPSEMIVPDFAPTRDVSACFVGYRCQEILRGGRG